MHLELLYCPFGVKNGFTNPFAPDFSMTSLERVLNSGEEGMDTAENGSDVKHKRREVIMRGVLSVTVISAEDLAPADVMGKADPYVVVAMKKTEAKNKTRVLLTSSMFWSFYICNVLVIPWWKFSLSLEWSYSVLYLLGSVSFHGIINKYLISKVFFGMFLGCE